MTLLTLVSAALVLTWIGTKSSYWILKSFAGFTWFGVLAYWLVNRPVAIAAGTPTDQIIILILIGLGLACLFMPLWYDKDKTGKETNGKFRLPFTGEDEEEETEQFAPTRQERVTNYASRVQGALNGKRGRRSF